MKDSENNLELDKKFVEFYEAVISGNFVLSNHTGICVAFDCYLVECSFTDPCVENCYGFLSQISSQWDKFSGNRDYPIPSYTSPYDVYWITERKGTMWDKSTKYGRLRWELFEFIYNKCKERLEGNPIDNNV